MTDQQISSRSPVELGQGRLTIDDVVSVGRFGTQVVLPHADGEVRRQLDKSVACIQLAVRREGLSTE